METTSSVRADTRQLSAAGNEDDTLAHRIHGEGESPTQVNPDPEKQLQRGEDATRHNPRTLNLANGRVTGHLSKKLFTQCE